MPLIYAPQVIGTPVAGGVATRLLGSDGNILLASISVSTGLNLSGNVLTSSVAPGGSDTNIQYNDGGTFAGDGDLVWDKRNYLCTINGSSSGHLNQAALTISPARSSEPANLPTLVLYGGDESSGHTFETRDRHGDIQSYSTYNNHWTMGYAIHDDAAMLRVNGDPNSTVSTVVINASDGQYGLEVRASDDTTSLFKVFANGNSYVGGTLEVQGDTALDGALTVATTAAVSGQLTVTGIGQFDTYAKVKQGGSGAYAKVGGCIFDHYTDAGNSTTTQTDLYSDTTAANSLATDGDKFSACYGGIFVSSATATRQIKLFFGGTAIFDTGTLTISSAASWTMYAEIIRVSSSSIRYMVSLSTQNAALAAYTAVGTLTGLTLGSTNVLKITGQAGAVGAATGDILAKMGTVYFNPVA